MKENIEQQLLIQEQLSLLQRMYEAGLLSQSQLEMTIKAWKKALNEIRH